MTIGGPSAFYLLLMILIMMMTSPVIIVGVMIGPAVAAIAHAFGPEVGPVETSTADALAACVAGKAAYFPGAPRLAVRTCHAI